MGAISSLDRMGRRPPCAYGQDRRARRRMWAREAMPDPANGRVRGRGLDDVDGLSREIPVDDVGAWQAELVAPAQGIGVRGEAARCRRMDACGAQRALHQTPDHRPPGRAGHEKPGRCEVQTFEHGRHAAMLRTRAAPVGGVVKRHPGGQVERAGHVRTGQKEVLPRDAIAKQQPQVGDRGNERRRDSRECTLPGPVGDHGGAPGGACPWARDVMRWPDRPSGWGSRRRMRWRNPRSGR